MGQGSNFAELALAGVPIDASWPSEGDGRRSAPAVPELAELPGAAAPAATEGVPGARAEALPEVPLVTVGRATAVVGGGVVGVGAAVAVGEAVGWMAGATVGVEAGVAGLLKKRK